MNIVITDARTVTNGDLNLDIFSDFGNVKIYSLTDYGEIQNRIEYADMILCNKTPLREETLKNTKNLKYIGLFATGYNNIDIEYCKNNNITVCNAANYSTDAVAQHTFAYILNHYCRIAEYDEFVAKGGWKNSPIFSPFIFPTDELCGKTIGIIGYGSIGRAVAKIAKAFNMNVLVSTRTPTTDNDVSFVTLDELLGSSDIITLHCPLNDETNKLFNKSNFDKCKNGAFLINTARGPIVDEIALVETLKNGKLSGAAIDVLEVEPMKDDCPLLGTPNLIITPHVAWAPLTTRERLIKIVYDNIKAFLNGTPQNVVSK